jgi:DNA-directed RNA polymerase subunit RPC12/RpoP
MATMFPCPNCGGQLRFSAEKQQMKCVSCGELTDVDSYKPDDSVGMDSVNTKIYQCPNCAGEIQLIDNDGMEFCPFCGTQATMQEHFSDEGVPKFILPFQINKKQAREKYRKLTERIHFAPEGLDNEENIDKLVGMYVPYYLYEYSINDEITFKGETTRSTADYYITNYANVDVKVDVDSLKVPYDASQTLDDTIAVKLEPFPMDKLKDFNPNYLAGFFVENSTVDNNLYKDESLDKAINHLVTEVQKGSQGYSPSSGAMYDVQTRLANDLRYDETSGAYLPMYFLTTRYNDRVAYSMVNGASGNSYIDMPIEKRKMFSFAIKLSGILFAIILVASFFFNFSFKVKALCSYGALISSIIGYVGAVLANKTYRSDNHLDDKGYFGSLENVKVTSKKKKEKIKSKTPGTFMGFHYTIIFLAIAILIFCAIMEDVSAFMELLPTFIYPISTVLVIMSLFTVKKGKKKVMLLGLLGWIYSVGIRIADPPNDIYYYGALIIAFIIILISVNAIIDEYNRFATHPSPQFLKKGGRLENARD